MSVVKRTTQVKNASQAQAPPVSPETPTSGVPTAADTLAPLGALKQGLVQPSTGRRAWHGEETEAEQHAPGHRRPGSAVTPRVPLPAQRGSSGGVTRPRVWGTARLCARLCLLTFFPQKASTAGPQVTSPAVTSCGKTGVLTVVSLKAAEANEVN